MQIANIIPPALLNRVNNPGKYHLVLASTLRKNQDYFNYYMDRINNWQEWVILDNDAYEQEGVTSDIGDMIELLRAGFRPAEVVLGDVMFGPTCAQETVEMSKAHARAYHDAKLPWMPVFLAIPHGNTLEEYMMCAQELCRIPNVTTLGIAEKDAIKLAGGNRKALVRMISGMRPIHLFGMMEDMMDVKDIWVRHAVRGVDGSKLVVWGMYGKEVSPEDAMPPYPGRPDNFMDLDRNLAQAMGLEAQIISRNISVWKHYAEKTF